MPLERAHDLDARRALIRGAVAEIEEDVEALLRRAA